jgi:hypothetical protein
MRRTRVHRLFLFEAYIVFFLMRQNARIFDLYLKLVGSVFRVSGQRRGAADRLAVREIVNDSELRPADRVGTRAV